MTKNSETVCDVCAEIRNFDPADDIDIPWTKPELMAFLDRIEDANKREVDHVRQCLTGDCERFKLGAEPCTTCTVYAYEREMAAKYAEIETALKKQNDYHAALLTICTADKNAEGLREIAIDACNGKEVK